MNNKIEDPAVQEENMLPSEDSASKAAQDAQTVAEKTAPQAEQCEPAMSGEDAQDAVPETEPQNGLPAESVCPRCGTAYMLDTQFCSNCGQNLRAFIEPSATKPAHRLNKKKLRIVCIAVISVIVLALAGSLTYTSIRRSTGLKRITQAIEDYKAKNIAYDTAVQILNAMTKAKDDEVVAKAKTGKKTIAALSDSRVNMQDAQKALESEDYAEACRLFSLVIQDDPDYTQAQEQSAAVRQQWKSKLPGNVDALVKSKRISDATALVNAYLEVAEDTQVSNIQTFLDAESAYSSGDLKYAKEQFEKLPDSLIVGGISVRSRLDMLNKYAAVVKMCGIWKANYNYYETKATTRSGRWQNWYNNYYTSTTFLFMRCVINDDETIQYDTTVYYYTYTNFATNKASIKSDMESIEHSGKLKLPSSGKLTLTFSNTSERKSTLTYDGKEFNFKQHDTQWSSGTKYEWWVDSTYIWYQNFVHLDS